MKKLLATALAVFALAPVAVQAAVVPSDWNHDGLNFVSGIDPFHPYKSQQTFYDQDNHLLWTNGNLTGSTTYNWNDATGFVAQFNASTNLNVWNNEGLHSWHIPSEDEFLKLVATQTSVNPNTHTSSYGLLPFSPPENMVWTSKVGKNFFGQNGHYGFAGNGASFTSYAYADTVGLSLWLVTSVPEPETYAMLLAGLGLVGAVARRRQSKQA